jgi:solute:Na+ symporter, SSS family
MDLLAQLAGHWTWIDTAVVIGYLAITTIIGERLSGKQSSIQDFFLGGNKLPWYAVTGSMIATEISAVTFVGVPAIVFGVGGNFTYLQLGLIAGLLARLFVAFVLVPAYYKQRIYSPYDYMGNQLGGGARGVMTALFTVGGVLAQASRVYLTAVILELVLAGPLAWIEQVTGLSPFFSSVVIIGFVAMLWTIIGGIATVIWTDVMLFLVFVIGGLTAIFIIAMDLSGGFGELFAVGSAGNKFRLWDLDPRFDPTKEFTIWTAAIGSLFGNIGAYGTDQLMAQRIFCCRSPREAKMAVVAGYVGQAVTALMLLVGVGLWVYYKGEAAVHVENPPSALVAQGVTPQALPVEQWTRPLGGAAAELYRREPDRIFPLFILSDAIPHGLTGLIIAGIFAAAISSLDSILAALSQTTISAVYLPLREYRLRRRRREGFEPVLPVVAPDEVPQGVPEERAVERAAAELEREKSEAQEARHIVFVSRLLVVFYTIVLCAMTFVIYAYKDRFGIPILPLALGLAGWVQGALLAAFFLAWLPLNVNGRGLIWAAPLSVMCVISLRFHDNWWLWTTYTASGILLLSWLLFAGLGDRRRMTIRFAKTPILLLGCALLVWLAHYGYFEDAAGNKVPPAFPWWPVIGGAVAFSFGYLMADPRGQRSDVNAAVSE